MLYPLRSMHILFKLRDRRNLDSQEFCVSTGLPPDHGLCYSSYALEAVLSPMSCSRSQKDLYIYVDLKCASPGSFSLLIILSGTYFFIHDLTFLGPILNLPLWGLLSWMVTSDFNCVVLPADALDWHQLAQVWALGSWYWMEIKFSLLKARDDFCLPLPIKPHDSLGWALTSGLQSSQNYQVS